MKFQWIMAGLTALTLLGGTAQADDRKVVEAFYTQLLSAPNAADMPTKVDEILIQDWVSIPTPRGGKGSAGFIKSLKGFGAAIPDLKWDIQEILQEGNRYVVRSIATGTPAKPFFGVAPAGKSFKIMTIDIHTVEGGKIVRSYHVEEWAKAIQQLKAK